MPEPLLIRGGRVIDPARAVDAVADVLIVDGRVAAVGQGLPAADHRVLDASGLIVAPGLVDMHVHLRDPGQTHKEDLATGTAAAVRGGFTAVACMPNTVPPIDHPTVVEYVRSRAAAVAQCRVHPIGAITKAEEGRELAPIGTLAGAGVVALSDDGGSVLDAGLLRRALFYASMFDLLVIEHCEDPTLSAGGVMHAGAYASVLGLRGIPWTSEAAIVARDLLLAEETDARLHIAHVSTAAAVRLIREARARGVRVTAEVTPHHLVLRDTDVGDFDTDRKMNPPLRGESDRTALREALADGTIDAVATDHAPHAAEEKMVEFDQAPFGVVGLETALGVMLTHLVQPGVLSVMEAIRRMSTAPAAILGLPGGSLAPGVLADVVLIDPEVWWTVRRADLVSRSKNTPFDGWTLQGRAVLTIVGGEIRHNILAVEARA
ncbi:MAG TPA: dihydroorotase [bacterium]|nr:dihydroorotase [bacterium]